MKLFKYLLVPWAAIVVYCAVSAYSGTAGIVSYRALLREREKMAENLERLQEINGELEGTMDALLYDSETIRVKARELGYGREDELFIRVVGLPGARYAGLSPGMVRTTVRPFQGSGKSPQLAACCAALILLALFLSWDALHRKGTGRNSGSREIFTGIPGGTG
ncbi:MAG: septum formation initiator family protein [Treponema sp.]|jgi:cell division protein FtsB|nr:septum formation initiator family protein [Treponema sp.]